MYVLTHNPKTESLQDLYERWKQNPKNGSKSRSYEQFLADRTAAKNRFNTSPAKLILSDEDYTIVLASL